MDWAAIWRHEELPPWRHEDFAAPDYKKVELQERQFGISYIVSQYRQVEIALHC
jgi:hypothetical protein